MTDADPALALARRLAAAYGALPGVRGVALGGSRATGLAGAGSDVDLYVFSPEPPPPDARRAVAAGGQALELDNRAFGPGDEWLDGATGLHVDAMFWSEAWMEGQLDRVLVRHEPSVGWSTCFWHTAAAAVPLHDRDGWLAALQARARVPYPEPLRRAVVAHNLPLLAARHSSFRHQLERALARGDAVAACHRRAAFLASAFDVLLALNRVAHPGEKRLLEHVRARCPLRPAGFEDEVEALLSARGAGMLAHADALAAGLAGLARAEGLAP